MHTKILKEGSSGWNEKYLSGCTIRDQSDDPSHHERTLLPRSYISEGRKEMFNLTTHSTHLVTVI